MKSKTFHALTFTKVLCYTLISKRSKHLALFQQDQLRYFPASVVVCKATSHPLFALPLLLEEFYQDGFLLLLLSDQFTTSYLERDTRHRRFSPAISGNGRRRPSGETVLVSRIIG